MKKLILYVICAIMTLGVSAQTIPNTFNYQGRCNLENADIVVEFALKDASGKTIYTEKKVVHTSKDGSYSVVLGGGNDWASIDWKTSGYKLVTKINGADVNDCEIVSVPYANMASDVVGLDEVRLNINDLQQRAMQLDANSLQLQDMILKLKAEIESIDPVDGDELVKLEADITMLQDIVNVNRNEIDIIKKTLESTPGISIGGPNAPNPYDKLNGKKWYVLGDSFTEGDWTGAETPKFSEGKYAGEKKVYPFFIGNRTGMEVHNLAKCGMTLTSGGNSVLNVYKEIPADADYVTIYIGINDSHAMRALGNDDSKDTATFTGAFNYLLEWLVANRPYTHIGIIVSPSSLEASWNKYREATIKAAKRYGIPVLDICASDDVPYFLRQTGKEDVLESVRKLRQQQYQVTDANIHPNEHAHELQSHIIEEFLRRI